MRSNREGHSWTKYTVDDWWDKQRKQARMYSWKKKGYKNKDGTPFTWDDYTALISKQDYKCLICEDIQKTKALHVDHDHKTGIVRGILCSRCNTSIGILEHEMVNKWYEYLKNNK